MGDYMNNRIIVSLDADRAGQLWLVALDYIEYQNAAVRVSENEEVAEQLPEYYRFVSEVLCQRMKKWRNNCQSIIDLCQKCYWGC